MTVARYVNPGTVKRPYKRPPAKKLVGLKRPLYAPANSKPGTDIGTVKRPYKKSKRSVSGTRGPIYAPAKR